MRQRSVTPSRQRQRFWALCLLAALWTVAVAGLAAWLVNERVDAQLDRVDATASVRANALKDTLALSLAHFTALPTHLARDPEVQALVDSARVPLPAEASVEERARARQALDADPRVQAMNQDLQRMALDFNLPVVALLDRNGNMVAAGFANGAMGPQEWSVNLGDRDYFMDALNDGSAQQFLHGRITGTPGFLFASRILRNGEKVGVAVMMQAATLLNQLIADAPGSRVMVTDVNGVVVLSNRPSPRMQRLPPGPVRTDAQWIAQYNEVPQPLLWNPRRAAFSGREIETLEFDGTNHVQRVASLADPPLRIWVLAPLEPAAALLQSLLAGLAALWLAGCVLLWALWRRLHGLDLSARARRDLRAMTRALPLTVFRYEQPADAPIGHFTYLGRGAEALFGASRGEIESDPTLPWRLAGDPAKQPPTAPVEFAVRHDDQVRWLLAHSTPLRDADGTTVYNGYWVDITTRRETESRLQALFEHGPTGYVFFDPRRAITRCNPAAVALFGVDNEAALLGRVLWFPGLSADIQVDGRPSRECALELMRRHERSRDRVQSMEWRFRRQDASEFDTETSVIALEWQGEPQYCAMIQDVTLRKQAQAAMQRARDVAESASRTKSSFLANMSHELRTPMNAIIGMTHLALDDGLPARQHGYVEKAHQAACNLLQIVDDILDVSKIEAGQLELEQIDFELDAVIEAMADVLALRAEEKGLELLFSGTPDLPRRLVGDPTRLRQVLVNLGGNAIKFTDRGEVTVGMQVTSQEADGVELHGWVRDTGIGIAADALARLFQPFSQGDSSTTRRFGGTGLGLAISRQLVERMGGRLWVESEPGQGSTFHFTARFGRSPSRTPSRAWLAGELSGRRALLVDDNAAALEVLGTMLESIGIGVDRASSGEQALDLMARSPGSHTWVLLDWNMPGMDGVECARRILERSSGPNPSIVLVTAFGREEALHASADLALAGVLQKPVTLSSLYDCLLHARSAPEPAPAARPIARRSVQLDETLRQRLAGARVLLVEDHPLNQELACELLRRAGMQVEVAGDGREALERLASDDGFDAVLMDCQMPVMDGYAATRAMRADPRWQHLPVIAMTASAFADDRERALASGMNAHITKPLDVDSMLRTLAEWIDASRSARHPPAAAQGPDTSWVPAELAGAIDTADGLARCLGKVDLYKRLLRGFRDSETSFDAAVNAALVAGRWSEATRRAHDLKGLAGTIGAHDLHASAQALQDCLAGRDADAAKDDLSRVGADLQAVLREIDSLVDSTTP